LKKHDFGEPINEKSPGNIDWWLGLWVVVSGTVASRAQWGFLFTSSKVTTNGSKRYIGHVHRQ